MKKSYLFVSLCAFMGATSLTGCKSKHSHQFIKGYDQSQHYELCECGEKTNVADHVFTTSTTAANCEHGAIVTYTCECGYSYSLNDDNVVHNYEQKYDATNHYLECAVCHDKKDIVAHDFELVSSNVVNSAVIDTYKCKNCEYSYESDSGKMVVHKLIPTIKKVATCQESGIKEYKCTDCSYSFEEEYDDFEAHKWDNGTLDEGVTTYKCQNAGCIETKTVISHNESVSAQVKVDDLSKAGTIELKEAAINFDEDTLSGFTEDVTVAAEKIESQSISEVLSSETKELIKDAPIFDFTMKNGDEEVHDFLGKVTVSVPYSLREGEDPENIAVVYINDKGATENIAAKYSGGFVFFETNHFSYYAVVEMTREQACELLGHSYFVYRDIPSTCTKQGFVQKVCKRCGDSHVDLYPLIAHNYKLANTVVSTTTTHGYNEYTCLKCGDTYKTELPLAPENTSTDSFFLNFIKSVLADQIDAKYYAEGSESRESHGGEIIMSLSGEKPFMIETYDDEIEYIYYGPNEYNVNQLLRRDDQTIPNLMRVKDGLSRLPSSSSEIFGKIEGALYKICFTKSVENGLAHIRYDKDVAKTFIEKVKTLPLDKLFDYLLGDGTYQEVMDFVEASFARTIEETLNVLSEMGLDSKDIFAVVKALPFDIRYEYEDIFTEQLLSTKLSDFLSEVFDKEFTFTQFKGLVESYKDNTLFELITDLCELEEDFIEENVLSIIESNLDSVELDFLLTQQGQLISGTGFIEVYGYKSMFGGKEEIHVDPIPQPQEEEQEEHHDEYNSPNHVDKDGNGYCDLCNLPMRRSIFRADNEQKDEKVKLGDITLSLTTAIDMEKSKALVNENVSKIDKIENDFKFTIYDGPIVPILEDYYGLKFTIDGTVENYCYVLTSESTTKFSKDIAITTKFGDMESRISSIPESSNPVSGKLMIVIYKQNLDGSYNWRNSFSRIGYGDCANGLDGDNLLVCHSSYMPYLRDIIFVPDNLESYYYVNNNFDGHFKIIYNIDTGEFDYVPSSQLEHEYKVTKVSYIEYKKNRYEVLNPEMYDYFRIECKHCDHVFYDYGPKGRPCYYEEKNVFLDSSKLNDEAKKFGFQLIPNYNYNPNDNRSTWIRVIPYYGIGSTLELNDIARNTSSRVWDPEKNDYIYDWYKDTTFNFGNVSISFTYTNPEFDCTYNEIITIKIDGQLVRTIKNIIHETRKCGYETKTVEQYTHGCYDYETRQDVCNCCGKVIDSWTSTVNSHHNYQEVGRIEPTEALDGYVKEVCSECGETHSYYLYKHIHDIRYDYENDRYVCEDCRKTWDSYPEHDFVIEDVTEQYLAYKEYNYEFYSSDVTAFAIADLCRDSLYIGGYELILGGYKDGELDLNYVSAIDSDRIIYEGLYFKHPFFWTTYSEIVVFQNSELEEFAATLPEGYEAGVALVKFTKTQEQLLSDLRTNIEQACDTFSIEKDTIENMFIDETEGSVYGYRVTTLIDIESEEDLENLKEYIEFECIPDGFNYETCYYVEDGFFVVFKNRYYAFFTYNVESEMVDDEMQYYLTIYTTLPY